MQDSGLAQIFQEAPPASATAISDPMMAATRVLSFMGSSAAELVPGVLSGSC
jgi:hypothetical protein